jgi:hypothetical protein
MRRRRAPSKWRRDQVLHDGFIDTDTDEGEDEAEKLNVHVAHQQEAWTAILGFEGGEVKAPWQ